MQKDVNLHSGNKRKKGNETLEVSLPFLYNDKDLEEVL